jgi:hypothetical protein
LADELEPEVQHHSVNRVKDPRGDMMSEVGGEFAIGAEGARTDWLTGVILATVVQFEATEEGTYTIKHDVDDASASLPIHIIHGQPGSATS